MMAREKTEAYTLNALQTSMQEGKTDDMLNKVLQQMMQESKENIEDALALEEKRNQELVLIQKAFSKNLKELDRLGNAFLHSTARQLATQFSLGADLQRLIPGDKAYEELAKAFDDI